MKNIHHHNNSPLVGMEPFWNLGQVFRVGALPLTAHSGGAGAAAGATSGYLLANLVSGTANSGWARAALGRGITAFPTLSGTGIDFSKKQGVAIVFGATGSYDNLGNIMRLVFGSNLTPAVDATDVVDGTNAVTYASFGVEIKSRGTSRDWRIFAHDGTSITHSAWTNTDLPPNTLNIRQYLSVLSDGAGTITASLGSNGSRTLATITHTGGPTAIGLSANSYVQAEVANSATGTSSLTYALMDAVFYAE